jgi:hypothetical protein
MSDPFVMVQLPLMVPRALVEALVASSVAPPAADDALARTSNVAFQEILDGDWVIQAGPSAGDLADVGHWYANKESGDPWVTEVLKITDSSRYFAASVIRVGPSAYDADPDVAAVVESLIGSSSSGVSFAVAPTKLRTVAASGLGTYVGVPSGFSSGARSVWKVENKIGANAPVLRGYLHRYQETQSNGRVAVVDQYVLLTSYAPPDASGASDVELHLTKDAGGPTSASGIASALGVSGSTTVGVHVLRYTFST